MTFGRVLVGTLVAGALMGAAPQQKPTEEAKAVHLLQRATFGVRPQDIDQVMKLGRERWLDQQLRPEQLTDAGTAQRLERFRALNADMGELLTEFQQAQRERRQMADSQMNRANRPNRNGNAVPPQQLLAELVSAKLTRAVYSERQLEEMMTDFWFNHFNVHFGKGIDRYLIADYEASAIRPHVFGKFRDLLGATAKHPAMLFYLDNAQSVAIDTTRMRRVPQQLRSRGLNENYARELMELHTLGVDGGYTQKDVIEVARALTGWQFTRPGNGAGPGNANANANANGAGSVEFVFRPFLHDRGEKTVLGHPLPAGRGIEDGEQVLDILAAHPSTAKFIAGKLVERFVSDEPDAAFVNEIAAVFTKTNGDLRAVTRALFSSPRFYATKVVRTKVKTPFELVASALRVTGAEVGVSRPVMQMLRTLGHLPYNEPAPTGFPASSEDWVNSGAMLNRMNFATSLAANRLQGVRVSNSDWTLQQLIPGADVTKLAATIERENATGGKALGLALGSPEFQRK